MSTPNRDADPEQPPQPSRAVEAFSEVLGNRRGVHGVQQFLDTRVDTMDVGVALRFLADEAKPDAAHLGSTDAYRDLRKALCLRLAQDAQTHYEFVLDDVLGALGLAELVVEGEPRDETVAMGERTRARVATHLFPLLPALVDDQSHAERVSRETYLLELSKVLAAELAEHGNEVVQDVMPLMYDYAEQRLGSDTPDLTKIIGMTDWHKFAQATLEEFDRCSDDDAILLWPHLHSRMHQMVRQAVDEWVNGQQGPSPDP